MPEWTRIVRDRLADLKLDPASEAEIIDEIAQHLEDRFRELCASGLPEAEAQHRRRASAYQSLAG